VTAFHAESAESTAESVPAQDNGKIHVCVGTYISEIHITRIYKNATLSIHEKGEMAKADKAISLIETKIRMRLELLDSIHVTAAIVQNASS